MTILTRNLLSIALVSALFTPAGCDSGENDDGGNDVGEDDGDGDSDSDNNSDRCNEGECGEGEYCQFAEDGCEGPGVCVVLEPELICTADYSPVCGCDGVTYSNRCGANGSNVDYEGECEG